MSIKKKGLGKGLDSLIPDNKSIKSVTPDKSAEAKKEAEEKAAAAEASQKAAEAAKVAAEKAAAANRAEPAPAEKEF